MKIPEDHVVYEATVPFHDCDPLAIVWHGNYYKYFEIAREKLLARYRLTVKDFMELGWRLLMIETRCRHVSPLHHDDRFQVKAWFIEHDMRLHLGYEIRNLSDEGKRVAKAWTTLVCTDGDGVMQLEVPRDIRARIEAGPVDE